MTTELSCFKAYDIRGKLGSELNEDIAYRIGRAYGQFLNPTTVVVGGDIRLSSDALKQALANGLLDSGVAVIDLGMPGTEEIYFAPQNLAVDGGIEVTASHNPRDYNGMKLVRDNGKPISGDSGLNEIKQLVALNQFTPVTKRGRLSRGDNLAPYIDHLMSYIKPQNIRRLKLVVNAGNGAAGHVIDAIEAQFKQLGIEVEFIKVHHQPDGHFPNGIPNPLLIENRAATSEAVIKHGADMGIAWDGDFDRCFLFDEQGQFIEGYYIVGLLGEAFLSHNGGAKIIHDPRLTWNTIDLVEQAGGQAIICKTGHAFIKERMRQEDAVYGGEMSAHHYFRDFGYCDSGMIPWLLITEMLSLKNQSLSQLVAQRIALFPASGEINSTLAEPQVAIARVKARFDAGAVKVEHIDGLSIEHLNWRFNLRSSNTEPVVRLNVESRGDVALMQQKPREILALLTN